FARVVAELDLTLFQRLPIRRADDRQQYTAAGPIRQPLPVNIERHCMRRSLAPFQHVKPPGIIREMHADMIGDEIKNKAEAMLPQRFAQSLETGIAAKLRIDPCVIDDIIAMATALAGLHEWRGIKMRD